MCFLIKSSRIRKKEGIVMKRLFSALLVLLMLSGCVQATQKDLAAIEKDDFFVFSDGRATQGPGETNIWVRYSETDAPLELETKRGLRIGDSADRYAEQYGSFECLVVPLLLSGISADTDPYSEQYRRDSFESRAVKEGQNTVVLLYATKDDEAQDFDILFAKLQEAGYIDGAGFDALGFLAVEFQDGYVTDITVGYCEPDSGEEILVLGPIAPSNSPTISLVEYDAIEAGMGYEEVQRIIGSSGRTSLSLDRGIGGEYVSRVYVWEGEGRPGSTATITFRGDRVIFKFQYGLE